MNTTVYWTIRRMKRGTREFRFTLKCWWLSQRVDFWEWRWRIDGLLAQPQPAAVPAQAGHGGRYAVPSM